MHSGYVTLRSGRSVGLRVLGASGTFLFLVAVAGGQTDRRDCKAGQGEEAIDSGRESGRNGKANVMAKAGVFSMTGQ
jgi:hypothetical protein